ncbi:hypothetical protein [Microbacterium sp. SORGH_AS_0888]|uniref:hypothetical protein n=1 Tax=Microbacterium sp. SORGH_AS_0888 TaxID=3041791 RepID=UPI0027D8A8E4|nr:hypothetical protein [Microbacterium sp. SORGH_AS_0888]
MVRSRADGDADERRRLRDVIARIERALRDETHSLAAALQAEAIGRPVGPRRHANAEADVEAQARSEAAWERRLTPDSGPVPPREAYASASEDGSPHPDGARRRDGEVDGLTRDAR